mmetsp:Transcript_29161/g.25792  ORF Transcript_29161/g.25792 Transcript_29161/m.25792 type:complete len:113 (-) Transcript_29161:3-341(-)
MTAVMKIMFGKGEEAKLTRNEMVGLVNLLAKMSDSLIWYQQWIELEDSREFYHILYKAASVLLLPVIFIVFLVDNIQTAKRKRDEMKSDYKNDGKEESKELKRSNSRKRKIE